MREKERERGQCYKVNQYAASGVRGHARTGQTEIPQKTATLVVRYACLALQQMVRNTPRKTENTPNTSCVCCFCQCCETADCAPRSSLQLHYQRNCDFVTAADITVNCQNLKSISGVSHRTMTGQIAVKWLHLSANQTMHTFHTVLSNGSCLVPSNLVFLDKMPQNENCFCASVTLRLQTLWCYQSTNYYRTSAK